MDEDLVYRNPPWVMGPTVYRASEIDDVLDWGQVAQGFKDVWPLGRGQGIRIGVCDTGRPTHPDLVNQIEFSKNFSSSYSDVDRQGHGTHVAGTIAAAKDGKGSIGGAYESRLVIAKVLGDEGSGDNRSVAAGIRYCLEKNCDIISMSLGGGYDPEIEKAVYEAIQARKFVICAAGNDGYVPGKNTIGFPARLPGSSGNNGPVAVGSYNKNGLISKFSSRGLEVDVAFPGEEIISCWLDNGYRALSGTSMATPCCAAAVAVLLSHQRELERKGVPIANPVRTQSDLLDRLRATAADKGPQGKDNAWGWGIVNLKDLMSLTVNETPPTVTTTTTTPPPKPVPPVTPPGSPIETDLGYFRVIVPAVYEGKTGLFLYVPK